MRFLRFRVEFQRGCESHLPSNSSCCISWSMWLYRFFGFACLPLAAVADFMPFDPVVDRQAWDLSPHRQKTTIKRNIEQERKLAGLSFLLVEPCICYMLNLSGLLASWEPPIHSTIGYHSFSRTFSLLLSTSQQHPSHKPNCWCSKTNLRCDVT